MSKQIKITKPGVSIRGTVREVGTLIDVCEHKLVIKDEDSTDLIHEPVAVRLIAEGKAEAIKGAAKTSKP